MDNVICMRTRLQYMTEDKSLSIRKRMHCEDTHYRMLDILNSKIKLSASVKRPRKKKIGV